MPETMKRSGSWARLGLASSWLVLLLVLVGCQRERPRQLEPRAQTWAELREVRRGVRVTPPDESARAPYPRERLADGARVDIEPGGLGWLRRDGGGRLLVQGKAELVFEKDRVDLRSGRCFVDAPPGVATDVTTPGGALTFTDVRATVEVSDTTRVYVLSGTVRAPSGEVARSGEELVLAADGAARIAPVTVFSDWTGGLATTEPAAAPAPFGMGTVGAREPGTQGSPRFPLAIQRLDVRVSIDGDFAVTEVDQRFFNPSSRAVEGIYRFRTPEGASIQRFGVDRGDRLVWGRVKESAAAAAQYQANVYQGSTEDPALLEWDGAGAYRARLYPIGPGEHRRVVIRYTEWLARTGERGERRAYVYPMAASGAEASLPRVEQLTVRVDIAGAGAKEVRTGMQAKRKGNELLLSQHDVVPRADFFVELFDEGQAELVAYRAPHKIDVAVLPPEDRERASREAEKELDYVVVPVRAADLPEAEPGVDLSIVVDASAANDTGSMALARAATMALLGHLGERDRALVWAGSDTLRPLVPGARGLARLDAAALRNTSVALSVLERGGATDLTTMLVEAARGLDPKRRGAVVYIGDGKPTVGESAMAEIEKRLASLPRPVRIFALSVGTDDNLALLTGLARGGFARRVQDAHGAAETALALLEHAERPAWLSVSVDLGPGVERTLPKKSSALVHGETAYWIGRVSDRLPESVTLRGADGGERQHKLSARVLEDHGDLRRRWAEVRRAELLEEDAGRAALVDLGMRFGIITPVTSFYVPTARELATESPREEPEEERAPADNKEGGTGTRAKGEEGSMGKRYAVAGPQADPQVARQAALRDAAEFGMIGLLNAGAGGSAEVSKDDKPAEAPAPSATSASGNLWGADIAAAPGAGGLGLTGVGEGGGGRGDGVGLGAIGTVAHGHGTGTGQGFGSGHGRLGGSHKSAAANVRAGAVSVEPPRLPAEVATRIVRQNFGRFRLCYEGGLARNPNLSGSVGLVIPVDATGSVGNVTLGGSDLPDSTTLECLRAAAGGLTFPQPEGGALRIVQRLSFEPAGGGAGVPALLEPVRVTVDVLPRTPRYCSAAANQPLFERVALWRERLAAVRDNPGAVYDVYRRALGHCEAPTLRERRLLLSMMVDALPQIRNQVAVWRGLDQDRIAQDAFYRVLVARVRTPEQRRQLYAAQGVHSVDPGRLETVVKTPDPALRVRELRKLRVEFPTDFRLGLRLMEALEDAGDAGAATQLAESLRSRPDADASVRTAVGEFFLRLARANEKERTTLQARARRVFGEIVEFSPDDPVLRRLLGDLLRSHGWYADARRQYETLAWLAPDDASVPLLVALAQEGEGQLEAAVRWTEKGLDAGAPDASQGPAATARALAQTFLAWGRLEAREKNRGAELATLLARATGLASADRQALGAGPKAILTWSHPELHPQLLTGRVGAVAPSPEGDVTLGISMTRLAAGADTIEIRVEPDAVEHAARLGAKARLTVIFDELGKQEKILRLDATFARGGPNVIRFRVTADGQVQRV